MPPKIAKISIPQPCHEAWENMTPAGRGRACAACQKVVVDFAAMTDAEVLAYLQNAVGRTCGRFGAGQLNRVNVMARPIAQPQRWRALLLMLLGLGGGALGITPVAYAQVQAEGNRPNPPLKVLVEEELDSQSYIFRGQFFDIANSNYLPGAYVTVKKPVAKYTTSMEQQVGLAHNPIQNPVQGTSSDHLGNFSLDLTRYQQAKIPVTLVFSYVGFLTQETTIDFTKPNVKQFILMNEDAREMAGEVVVVPYRTFFLFRPFIALGQLFKKKECETEKR